MYGGGICEKPYYLPPDEFLRLQDTEREIQRILPRMREDTVNRERARHSEEERRQSSEGYKEKTRALIDAIPQQLWSGPSDGSIDFCNERWRSDTGLSLDQLRGKGWQNMLHPDDRERVLKAWQESVARGTPYEQEERHRGVDGKYRWFLSRGVPVRDDEGRIVRWYGTNTDIEDQKLAEEALRENEERYRKLVDILPAAIYVCDNSGRIQQFNRAAAEMWGREPSIGVTGEQFCGSYRLRRPDHTPIRHDESPMAEVLRTGLPVRNAEVVIEKPHGPFVAAVANIVPLHNQAGQLVGAINCVYDITERKLVEEQLRENEADLAEAQRIARLGSWKFNLADDSVTWSEEVYRIFEVDKAAFGGVYESFLSHVHPDDRARVVQTNRVARESAGPFEIEYRIVTRAGGMKNVREVGYVMKDARGDVLRLFGTVQDITDYKRAQEDLQKLSGRLLQLQDEERSRIARELHDTTGQNLVALATTLSRLRELLPKSDRKCRRRLSESKTLAERCIQEIRTLSYVLHPPVLEHTGLQGAIRDYVKGFTKRSGVQVDLELTPGLGRLPREVELALFRVVQESLTNIQLHSGSKKAKIQIDRDPNHLILEIRDGKDESLTNSSKRPARPAVHFGVGIHSMQERVRLIGGRLEIDSASQGTTVRVAIPLGGGSEKSPDSIS